MSFPEYLPDKLTGLKALIFERKSLGLQGVEISISLLSFFRRSFLTVLRNVRFEDNLIFFLAGGRDPFRSSDMMFRISVGLADSMKLLTISFRVSRLCRVISGLNFECLQLFFVFLKLSANLCNEFLDDSEDVPSDFCFV